MNKDIRLCVSFWDHWKTVTLKADLGLEAIESLQRLWIFSAQNKPDGILSGMSLKAIEISAKWSGMPGQLVSKLTELSFLDFDGKTYSLHDWEDHNGFVAHAGERKERARRNAESGWIKRSGNANGNTSGNASGNANGNASGNASGNANGNADCYAPSPSPTPSPTPTPNTNPPTPPRGGKAALPSWIDPDVWENFIAHRIAIKAKMSTSAQKLVLAKLEKLRDAGCDPSAVLNQSIENGWKGLFELKAGNGREPPSTYRTLEPDPEYEARHADLYGEPN